MDSSWWPIPVTALGFVDRMSDLMGASDLLVTKAGPGTIAEATIRGLPMILYGYIPARRRPMSTMWSMPAPACSSPVSIRLAAEAARLMTTRARAPRRDGEASRRLGRPEATREIVASILGQA